MVTNITFGIIPWKHLQRLQEHPQQKDKGISTQFIERGEEE